MYRHYENALFLFLPILVGVVGEYALYYTPKNEPHVHELGRMLTVAIGYMFLGTAAKLDTNNDQ